ncbi:MAG: hypothetical protein WCO00_17300 [Rhodospirillaceae bacterium]
MIKGKLCISCYNREREVARGKNRKGHVPVKVAGAIRSIIAIFAVDGVEDIREFNNVTSINEIIVLLLREFGRDAVVEVRETDAKGTAYQAWHGDGAFVLGGAGRGLVPIQHCQGSRAGC